MWARAHVPPSRFVDRTGAEREVVSFREATSREEEQEVSRRALKRRQEAEAQRQRHEAETPESR